MASCIKLEWAELPEISPCAIGEPADYRCLKIRAIYDDGSGKIVAVTNRMFNESDLQAEGSERKCVIVYEKQRLSVTVPLTGARLDHIEVKKKPGLICREGEGLDRSQVLVKAFYDDGTSREISFYKLSPYATLSVDTKEVVFRYGRYTATLSVTVVPKEQEPSEFPIQAELKSEEAPINLSSDHPETSAESAEKTVLGVNVVQIPLRQEYFIGDSKVDLQGGRVALLYDDGTVEQIDMTADGSIMLDSSRLGKSYVRFTCAGKPVFYPVQIVQSPITRIEISQMPKKVYYTEGDLLDLTGLILLATYQDNSIREIADMPPVPLTITKSHGDTGVELNYEGAAFMLPIHVVERSAPAVPTGIELRKAPDKTVYIEGYTAKLDLTGAELVVHMSDGREQVVPVTPDMVDPVDFSLVGRFPIVIHYQNFTATYLILINPRVLTSLVVTSGMSKTNYFEGEHYDLRDVVISALYDNGEREIVSDYQVDHSIAMVGDTELILSYQGLTISFPVTVKMLEVVLLDWIQPPFKSSYYTHEQEFSCEGGRIKVKRNDGSETEVALENDMVSGFHTDHPGVLPLKVSYLGKVLPFTVKVEERILLELRIMQKPKVEYMEGEEFDPDGLIVRAFYSGDTSEEVSVSYMPYGPLKQGTTSMMLIYEDKAISLPITVVPSNGSVSHKPIIVPPYQEDPNTTPTVPQVPTALQDEAETPPADNQSSESREDVSVVKETRKIERKEVPDFYPSSFCIRFGETTDSNSEDDFVII